MRFLNVFLPLLCQFIGAQATCYLPNGKHSPQEVPCNARAEVSHCCGSVERCLSNGLCIWDPDETNATSGKSYVRATCTDQTWKDPRCPQHCLKNQDSDTNPDAYDFSAGGVLVLECGVEGFAKDASYCCESTGEGFRCCKTSSALSFIERATRGEFTGYTISRSSSTKVGTSSAQPTETSTTIGTMSTPPAIPMPSGETASQDNNIGWKIGTGIGGALAFILILAAAVILLRKRKKAKSAQKSQDNQVQSSTIADFKGEVSNYYLAPKAELDTAGGMSEMPGEARATTQELPVAELELPGKRSPVELDAYTEYDEGWARKVSGRQENSM